MGAVEPVPGEPAATVALGGERALVVADYHAGIEAGLRYERGVELSSDAEGRRERLFSLLNRTAVDRLVVLGDLGHRIDAPEGVEADELDTLVDAVTTRVPLTLVRGNHDGGVAEQFGDRERVEVAPSGGTRIADTGFAHGHTWPTREVLAAERICTGHEHPTVRLRDSVGGSRVERVWLRGPLRPEPFAEHLGVEGEDLAWRDPELVVFPAFNDRSGGTRVNVEGRAFLSPFLPTALREGETEAYLLDGTRLGDYRRV